MLTDRRHAQRMQEDTSVEVPLILSILMHALLAVGLYFISKPHPPKQVTGMQTTLITADMLREMTAQTKQLKEQGQQAQSTPAKTDAENNLANIPVTETPTENDVTVSNDLVPSVLTPKPQKTTPPKPVKQQPDKPIFKKVPNSERKKNVTPPKEEVVKPKTGEPDKAGIEKTKAWAKQQQKVLNDMKKQKQREEDLKRKARQREKSALAAQRAEEKQKIKEKRDAEKQRLANMKKAEAEKDKKLAERRKKNEEIQKAQRARQEKERKEQEAARRKASLSEGSKNLGSMDDEFAKDAKALKGPSSSQVSNARSKYASLIQQKVRRNWTKNTDKIVTVPVTIRISRNGNVLSAKPKTSDALLKQSIREAVMKSSPLPVPPEDAIFNKIFRKPITINFRTK